MRIRDAKTLFQTLLKTAAVFYLLLLSITYVSSPTVAYVKETKVVESSIEIGVWESGDDSEMVTEENLEDEEENMPKDEEDEEK